MIRKFNFTNVVERFPQKGGWYYVSTGMTCEDLGIETPKWGLVAAEIKLGKTVWKKSLLPYGDGTLFVALNKKVRDAENIELGDEVTIEFRLLGV